MTAAWPVRRPLAALAVAAAYYGAAKFGLALAYAVCGGGEEAPHARRAAD